MDLRTIFLMVYGQSGTREMAWGSHEASASRNLPVQAGQAPARMFVKAIKCL